MKKFLTLVVCGWVLASIAQAAEPPRLSAEQALKIASGYLSEKGYAGAHYVSGLTLEATSLGARDFAWSVVWSPSVKLSDRLETGLRISMDGTLARIVSGSAQERARENSRQGSRNLR